MNSPAPTAANALLGAPDTYHSLGEERVAEDTGENVNIILNIYIYIYLNNVHVYIYICMYIQYQVCYIIFTCLLYICIYIYIYFFWGCVSEQEIRSLNPIGLLPKSTTNRLWCRGGNIFGHPNQTKIPIWIYRE